MLVEFHVVFVVGEKIEEIFLGLEVLRWFKFVRGFRGKQSVDDLSYSSPIVSYFGVRMLDDSDTVWHEKHSFPARDNI